MTSITKIAAFPTSGGLTMIPLADILYCRSNGNTAIIFLKDKTSLFSSKPLKDLEMFLPNDWFIRIHHQAIVNKMHIRHYRKSDGKVLLSDGTPLSIAVRKRNILSRYFEIL